MLSSAGDRPGLPPSPPADPDASAPRFRLRPVRAVAARWAVVAVGLALAQAAEPNGPWEEIVSIASVVAVGAAAGAAFRAVLAPPTARRGVRWHAAVSAAVGVLWLLVLGAVNATGVEVTPALGVGVGLVLEAGFLTVVVRGVRAASGQAASGQAASPSRVDRFDPQPSPSRWGVVAAGAAALVLAGAVLVGSGQASFGMLVGLLLVTTLLVGIGVRPRGRATSTAEPIIRGVVSGMDRQTPQVGGGEMRGQNSWSGATETHWRFRVVGDRGAGPLVPVTLVGATILGVLDDGDDVEVHTSAAGNSAGSAARNGPHRASYVRNLTTGALVQPSSDRTSLVGTHAEVPTADGEVVAEVRGLVTGLTTRVESIAGGGALNVASQQVTIWTFRVLATGASGGLLVVPVELREYGAISGTLRNGDAVAIPGPWRRGQTLRPLAFDNASTGERITVRDVVREQRTRDAKQAWYWRTARLLAFLIVALFLAAVVAMLSGAA
jgi:hypothetical protein